MKWIRGMIILLCAAVIAFSSWKIYGIQSEYSKGEKAYAELETFVVFPSGKETSQEIPSAISPTTQTAESTTIPEETLPTVTVPCPEVNFDELKRTNSQIVGWIYVPDTPISYPVAQAENNEFYLEHIYTGEYNAYGCIFLDCNNKQDFSDPNSVLYGHNMNNGSMFAGLNQYKKQQFYDDHPYFLLLTPEANYYVEVFASVVMGDWTDAWNTTFADDEEYEKWLSDKVKNSRIQTDVTPTVEDHILTLSTCTYEFTDSRLLVMGRMTQVQFADFTNN